MTFKVIEGHRYLSQPVECRLQRMLPVQEYNRPPEHYQTPSPWRRRYSTLRSPWTVIQGSDRRPTIYSASRHLQVQMYHVIMSLFAEKHSHHDNKKTIENMQVMPRKSQFRTYFQQLYTCIPLLSGKLVIKVNGLFVIWFLHETILFKTIEMQIFGLDYSTHWEIC